MLKSIKSFSGDWLLDAFPREIIGEAFIKSWGPINVFVLEYFFPIRGFDLSPLWLGFPRWILVSILPVLELPSASFEFLLYGKVELINVFISFFLKEETNESSKSFFLKSSVVLWSIFKGWLIKSELVQVKTFPPFMSNISAGVLGNVIGFFPVLSVAYFILVVPIP